MKEAISSIESTATSVTNAAKQKVDQLTSSTANPGPVPDMIVSPDILSEADTQYIKSIKPVSNTIKNFISTELGDKLITFLDSTEKTKENGHSVVSYGAAYTYGGYKGKNNEVIPPLIAEVITKIHEEFPDQEVVNCCLAVSYTHLTLPTKA